MTEAQQRAYDQAQVMLAFSQGKKVECKYKDGKDRWEETPSPSWDFYKLHYRIAPEPQEVWLWVKRGAACYIDGTAVIDNDLKDMGYTKKLFREVLDA